VHEAEVVEIEEVEVVHAVVELGFCVSHNAADVCTDEGPRRDVDFAAEAPAAARCAEDLEWEVWTA
jgi:hypothetical protein